jgi:hypothetical protein
VQHGGRGGVLGEEERKRIEWVFEGRRVGGTLAENRGEWLTVRQGSKWEVVGEVGMAEESRDERGTVCDHPFLDKPESGDRDFNLCSATINNLLSKLIHSIMSITTHTELLSGRTSVSGHPFLSLLIIAFSGSSHVNMKTISLLHLSIPIVYVILGLTWRASSWDSWETWPL